MREYVRNAIKRLFDWSGYREREEDRIAAIICNIEIGLVVEKKLEQAIVDVFDVAFFNAENDGSTRFCFDDARIRGRLKNAVINMVRDELKDNKSIRLDKLD